MAAVRASAEASAPRGRGRPTLFTLEIRERILAMISVGNTYEIACAAAGIHRDTYYGWLQKGKDGRARSEYGKFFRDVEQAKAIAAVTHNQRIFAASAEDYRASQWFLERRYPETYGRRERVEHSGPEGGPIEQRVTLEDIDEYLAISRHNEQADEAHANLSPIVTPPADPPK